MKKYLFLSKRGKEGRGKRGDFMGGWKKCAAKMGRQERTKRKGSQN